MTIPSTIEASDLHNLRATEISSYVTYMALSITKELDSEADAKLLNKITVAAMYIQHNIVMLSSDVLLDAFGTSAYDLSNSNRTYRTIWELYVEVCNLPMAHGNSYCEDVPCCGCCL